MARDHWGEVRRRGRASFSSFTYALPTEIIFGRGALSHLPDVLGRLGCRSPLVVMDAAVRQLAAIQESLDRLQAAGCRCVLFADVRSEPSTGLVEQAADAATRGRCDCVLGIGGGSALDAAKAAAALATNPGGPLTYAGRDKLQVAPLPIVAVPTTAGTGSEVTMWSVLTDERSGRKVSIGSWLLMPRVALLDPDLTLTLPPTVTAATGVDALSHALESYVSTRTNPITEALALGAIELIGRHLRTAVQQGDDEGARSGMLLASLMAEMAANTTRLGLAHALALPLGARYRIPHGLAITIVLPYVADYNQAAEPERYTKVMALLGRPGNQPLEGLRELLSEIGARQQLAPWAGIEVDTRAVAEEAMTSDNVLANPREAGVEEMEEILCRALEDLR